MHKDLETWGRRPVRAWLEFIFIVVVLSLLFAAAGCKTLPEPNVYVEDNRLLAMPY